jgi:hypothetical protein
MPRPFGSNVCEPLSKAGLSVQTEGWGEMETCGEKKMEVGTGVGQ